MNKVILIGRLCNDVDLNTTAGGSAVAKYRLAVNRDFKKDGKQEADFLNCVTFGKSAEFATKYLHKGMKVAVEGRIQTGSYEKDGVKHYTTDIIVDRHEFVESKGAAEDQYQAEERQAIRDEGSGFEMVQDESLPF